MNDLQIVSHVRNIEIIENNYLPVMSIGVNSDINSKYLFYATNSNRVDVIDDFISAYYYKLNRKEDFFINAIKNLRKKINFISLYNEFQNGDISDADFEKEIELNPDKYVVTVDNVKDNEDLMILHEVISKVNENLSIDEISEIFSIDLTGVNLTRQ